MKGILYLALLSGIILCPDAFAQDGPKYIKCTSAVTQGDYPSSLDGIYRLGLNSVEIWDKNGQVWGGDLCKSVTCEISKTSYKVNYGYGATFKIHRNTGTIESSIMKGDLYITSTGTCKLISEPIANAPQF